MTFWRVVGAALQAIGVAALLAAAVGIYWAYGRHEVPEKPVSLVEPLDRSDIESALTMAGVDPAQDWSVIASLRSDTGLIGRSHANYACLQLRRFDTSAAPSHDWAHEPEANPLLRDALAAALDQARASGARCMPATERALTADFARNFTAVAFDRGVPSAAVIFLYEPATRRLYYIDFAS